MNNFQKSLHILVLNNNIEFLRDLNDIIQNLGEIQVTNIDDLDNATIYKKIEPRDYDVLLLTDSFGVEESLNYLNLWTDNPFNPPVIHILQNHNLNHIRMSNRYGAWKTMIKNEYFTEFLGEMITSLFIYPDLKVRTLSPPGNPFQTILNNIKPIIHLVNTDLEIITLNHAMHKFLTLYGVKGEIIGRKITDIIPDMEESIVRDYAHVQKTGETYTFNLDDVINGQRIVNEIQIIPVFKNKKVEQIITIAQDITKEYISREKLEQSEKMMRSMMNAITETILIYDLDGKIQLINDVGQKRLNKSSNELLHKNVKDIFPGPLGEFRWKKHLEVLNNKRPVEFVDTRDEKIFHSQYYPILNREKEVDRVVVFAQDITDKENNRKALEKNEELLRSMINAITESILVFNKEGDIELINEIGMKRLKTTEEKIINKNIKELFPGSFGEELLERYKEVLKSKESRTFIDKRADVIYQSNNYPILDEKGEADKLVVFSQDITKQQETQKALEESEKLYRALFENNPNGVFLFLNRKCIMCNIKAAELLGYESNQDLLGEDLSKFFGKEELEHYLENVEHSNTYTGTEIIEIKRKNKSSVHVTINFNKLDFHEREMLMLIMNDMTEQVNIRKELDQKQKDMEIILNDIPIMFFLKDTQNRFLRVSDSYEQITGYPPEFFNNKSVFDIMADDPEKAQLAWAEDLEIIRTGIPKRDRVQNLFSDPRVLVNTQKFPHRDTKGNIIGIVGFAQDITEQVKTQNELKAALQHNKTLLRELNHRVKNNLMILNSLLDMHIEKDANEQTINIVKDIQDRIKSISFMHEYLFYSEDLSSIDFSDYLKQLLYNLLQAFNMPNPIKLEMDIEPHKLSADIAIPCGLIANELISNAVKHAFPEDREWEEKNVFVRFFMENDNYNLSICDNGIGYDFKEKQDSLGQKIVDILVKHQLQGSIEYTNDSGTCCLIQFAAEEAY